MFQPLTSQPADWASYYKNYYYKSGTKYKSVSGAEKQIIKYRNRSQKTGRKIMEITSTIIQTGSRLNIKV